MVPSTPLQRVDPVGGSAQMPTPLSPTKHKAEQQSADCPQMSPAWMQNEDAHSQIPLSQSCEQQSVSSTHELPAVRHSVFSGSHALSVHVPLQHSSLVSHAWLSDTH
jgi:hypothetical protein